MVKEKTAAQLVPPLTILLTKKNYFMTHFRLGVVKELRLISQCALLHYFYCSQHKHITHRQYCQKL